MLNKSRSTCSLHFSHCPFCDLLGAMIFTFSGSFLMIALFKVAPKHSAEMLPSVPK